MPQQLDVTVIQLTLLAAVHELALGGERVLLGLTQLALLGRDGGPGAERVALVPAVAGRLRRAVEAARPGDLDVTMSWGVATGADVEFDGLFAAADTALYRAKQDGRNRVALMTSATPLAVGERRLDLLDAA